MPTSPARTTARPAPRRPTADRTLSPDAIVDRALEVIERDGAAGLTVRKLGKELGVDATAFYRHFRDKDELLLACLDQVEMRAWKALQPTSPADVWQQTLRSVADVTWTMVATYPAVYAATSGRTTGGPGERRMVELLLTTLAGLGLDRATTVLHYRAFVDVLLSLSVSAATLARLGAEAAARNSAAWSRFSARLPEGDVPVSREHAAELASVTDPAIRSWVVEALIARMEQAAAAVRAGAEGSGPPDLAQRLGDRPGGAIPGPQRHDDPGDE